MARRPTRPVRVLVQHAKVDKGWSYRLVAYEDARTYIPLDFDAMGDLVNAIRRVIPDFSESSLVFRPDAERSYLAFSADCELDEGQLYLLGLNPQT
jgi:hypothetical protein